MKGGLIPMTIIEVGRLDVENFKFTLESKVAQMPAFFNGSPVVFALEKVADVAPDLEAMVTISRSLGLIPVSIRGGNNIAAQQARALGLAVLPASTRKADSPAVSAQEEVTATSPAEEQAEQVAPLSTEGPISEEQTPRKTEAVKSEATITKIVHHPVRSGQQIYAQGGDLIVLSAVSAGAEILADGNIHVYGPLRGRALAGIKGDTCARIFCQSLEAELVSVAGQYKISEDLQNEHWRQPRQIYLDGEKLTIGPLNP
ncbi:MAG: septum site-determining protein MinC [Bdellovibrionales bacterium]|nr:septum site-determining protein MinC [Bdellovibrionales bacterium]